MLQPLTQALCVPSRRGCSFPIKVLQPPTHAHAHAHEDVTRSMAEATPGSHKAATGAGEGTSTCHMLHCWHEVEQTPRVAEGEQCAMQAWSCHGRIQCAEDSPARYTFCCCIGVCNTVQHPLCMLVLQNMPRTSLTQHPILSHRAENSRPMRQRHQACLQADTAFLPSGCSCERCCAN